MPIYELLKDQIRPIEETTFAAVGVRERSDLQRLLRDQIDVICPEVLVISEEFGDWEDSRRRIDLLGIDKEANLVVIELKRTEDGGHMDLQSIRYASMVSVMEFDDAVEVFQKYLQKTNQENNPRMKILEFLGWDEPIEEEFAQDVHIVLAAAEFSKELTTSVMWLNERDLNLTCVRIKPFSDGDRVLLDVQKIIPIPEAEGYQVKLRQKQGKERASRRTSRESLRFDVSIDGEIHAGLPKRKAIFQVVKHLCDNGVTPDEIAETANLRKSVFRSVPGTVNAVEFERLVSAQGRVFDPIRYFWADGELLHSGGKTYAFSNQWGKGTVAAMKSLVEANPELHIDFRSV